MIGHLGEYKNVDSALVVLDEIQSIIFLNKLFNADVKALKKSLVNGEYTEEEIAKSLRTISIYEMPKE